MEHLCVRYDDCGRRGEPRDVYCGKCCQPGEYYRRQRHQLGEVHGGQHRRRLKGGFASFCLRQMVSVCIVMVFLFLLSWRACCTVQLKQGLYIGQATASESSAKIIRTKYSEQFCNCQQAVIGYRSIDWPDDMSARIECEAQGRALCT